MEIVKAFNENELHTEIVIKGTSENPLFRASDIGNVLEISTIRSIIRDFNETEKVVHSMHTLGGLQEVTFLTEKGLYKVLFKSRKPIAEKFQNWICDVIKEIRLHGIYDLQKQLNDLVPGLTGSYDAQGHFLLDQKTTLADINKLEQNEGEVDLLKNRKNRTKFAKHDNIE